jgi:hypothetical protein
MNKDEFEEKFKEEAKAAWSWSVIHKSIALPAAIFVIGFVLGAVSCHG